MKNTTLLVCLISLMTIFQFCSVNEKTVQNTDKPFISEPFANAKVAHVVNSINPAQSNTLDYESGTSLYIPDRCFVKGDGTPVEEPVEIKYREFHTAADVIASGIPMTFDTSGVLHNFQTAGMFDIEATSNNEEVFVADGKSITVNLASYPQDDGYNFYFLDEEKGNWEYLDRQPKQANKAREEKLIELEKPVDGPIQPIEYKDGMSLIDLNIDYERFPIFKELGHVMWQLTDDNELQDDDYTKRKWAFAGIDPVVDREDVYKITLRNAHETYAFKAIPVLRGKSYKNAKAGFNKRMDNFRELMSQRLDQKAIVARQAKAMRTFQISNMGIFNCDKVYRMPDRIALNADFDFGNELILKEDVMVYLITGDDRAVICFPYYSWSNMGYSPDQTNKFVAVLPNDKIATFSSQDFTGLTQNIRDEKVNSFDCTIEMNVLDETINSIDNLDEIIASL